MNNYYSATLGNVLKTWHDTNNITIYAIAKALEMNRQPLDKLDRGETASSEATLRYLVWAMNQDPNIWTQFISDLGKAKDEEEQAKMLELIATEQERKDKAEADRKKKEKEEALAQAKSEVRAEVTASIRAEVKGEMQDIIDIQDKQIKSQDQQINSLAERLDKLTKANEELTQAMNKPKSFWQKLKDLF